MNISRKTPLFAMATACILPVSGQRALFSDDFERNNEVMANDPDPAPNSGGGFCHLATGEGGPGQGAQVLTVSHDHNNLDHPKELAGRVIEANVFHEQIIGAGDLAGLGEENEMLTDDEGSDPSAHYRIQRED